MKPALIPRARHRWLPRAALWAALATVGLAHAQGQLPGGLAPGQIERSFQAPPESRAAPASVPIKGSRPAQGTLGHQPSFELRDVRLTGATRYDAATLRTHYAHLTGRTVTIDDLIAIEDAITVRYRNDGYILVRVFTPEQDVVDGVIEMRVIEGYLATVTVDGERPRDDDLVRSHADRLRDTRPLTAQALERHLLLMNDLPGATARGTLLPGGSDGGAGLHVEFEQRRLTAEATVDNRGSKLVGPWRGTAEIRANNLTGRHEQTVLRATGTPDRDLRFAHLAHTQPLGADGTSMVLSAGAARSRPDALTNLGGAHIESGSNTWGMTLQHPVQRSRSENVTVRASLTGHDGETRFEGLPQSSDRIRAIRVGVVYDRADAWMGVNIVELELSRGIDALGARKTGSPDASRANGRSDFTKLTLYGARLQSIAPRWSVLAAVSGQYAWMPLLAPEQYAFGGEFFGRGYDSAELLGDSGIAGKIELRYAGNTSFDAQSASYTAYSFYDFGRIYRRGAEGNTRTDSAAAAGLGLRLGVGRGFSGFVELAQPLTRDVRLEGNRDSRLYAGFAVRFQ